MKENQKTVNLFEQRLKNSNVFTEKEKNIIIKKQTLFEKCYYLGLLDALK